MRVTRSLCLLALLGLTACGADAPPGDGGDPQHDAGGADAGGGDGAAGDTWASFAEGFFAAYCVECHDASPKDFRSLEDVRANAATIRCGVSDVALSDCGSWPPPRQFPIGTGPHPSDAERARIVAWIDAGAP